MFLDWAQSRSGDELKSTDALELSFPPHIYMSALRNSYLPGQPATDCPSPSKAPGDPLCARDPASTEKEMALDQGGPSRLFLS